MRLPDFCPCSLAPKVKTCQQQMFKILCWTALEHLGVHHAFSPPLQGYIMDMMSPAGSAWPRVQQPKNSQGLTLSALLHPLDGVGAVHWWLNFE